MLKENVLGSPLCHDGIKPHCIGIMIRSLSDSLSLLLLFREEWSCSRIGLFVEKEIKNKNK